MFKQKFFLVLLLLGSLSFLNGTFPERTSVKPLDSYEFSPPRGNGLFIHVSGYLFYKGGRFNGNNAVLFQGKYLQFKLTYSGSYQTPTQDHKLGFYINGRKQNQLQKTFSGNTVTFTVPASLFNDKSAKVKITTLFAQAEFYAGDYDWILRESKI